MVLGIKNGFYYFVLSLWVLCACCVVYLWSGSWCILFAVMAHLDKPWPLFSTSLMLRFHKETIFQSRFKRTEMKLVSIELMYNWLNVKLFLVFLMGIVRSHLFPVMIQDDSQSSTPQMHLYVLSLGMTHTFSLPNTWAFTAVFNYFVFWVLVSQSVVSFCSVTEEKRDCDWLLMTDFQPIICIIFQRPVAVNCF